jgi:hypothetical protein
LNQYQAWSLSRQRTSRLAAKSNDYPKNPSVLAG